MDSLPSSSDLFNVATLARLGRLGTAAVGGTVLLQLPAMIGCADVPGIDSVAQNDWAQYEGQRNTTMVSYTGASWSVCRFPNTRFGCGSIEMWVKLRVRPVSGADINWKRVGVVYHTPDDPTERTAIGNYVTTWGNGDEEWHVPVLVSSSQKTILFDAWYQDGAGHTYVDDNNGELHVANDGPSYTVVRVEPWRDTVNVTPEKVTGSISVQVADLDFDKQIEIVCSTDGWNTMTWFGQGNQGEKNRWYWVEDYAWSGRERWQIDLDLPHGGEQLEYAVVYRHGVVNNAKVYEFWDNNFGSNYVVQRQAITQ
jgi:hypothetical protein